MSTRVQWRRGNTAQTAIFTGAVAEITVDTEKNVVVVHDGVTAGGFPAPTLSYVQAAFNAANNATDTWVRNQANLAFNQANSSFIKANAAFDAQNTTGVIANGAFDKANSAYTAAANAYNFTTSVNVYSYGAFTQANLAYNTANSAFINSNASYDQANTATTNAATADSKAVTAGNYANSAYNQANTATINADTADSKAVTAGNYANSAYNQANTATTNAATADSKAVTAGSYANSAFIKANSAYDSANSAGVYANGAYIKANSAFDAANTNAINITNASSYANSAFVKANAAYDQANTNATNITNTGSYANSAFIKANSAYDTANSASSYANGAFTQANAAFLQANTPSYTANSASSYANGAFAQANAAYNQSNTYVWPAANSAGSYANSAFAVANSAGSYANAAFLQANTPSYTANSAASYANGAFAQANAAYNQSNTYVWPAANSAGSYANASFAKANAAFGVANTANAIYASGGTIAGDVKITSATGSTTYASGALVVTGGVGVGQNLNVFGNTIISGSLTVQGATVYTSSTTTTYTNPIILLNAPAAGWLNSPTNYDIGLESEYYSPTDPSPRVVTGGSGNGTTATLNLSDSTYYPPGSVIQITGVTPSGFNGVWTVTAATPGSVSFNNSTNASVVTSGALGVSRRLTEFTSANVTRSGSTANVTYDNSYSAISLPVGSTVTISGFTNTQYNGNQTIASSGPGYFTYTGVSGSPGNETLAGKVVFSERHAAVVRASDTGHYEFYEVGHFTPANTFEGLYATVHGGQFIVTPNQAVKASDLTDGFFVVQGQTVIDATTATNGTVNNAYAVAFNPTTYSAANTGITYTTPHTVYIGGAPVAGNNVTLSGNSYALYVNSGGAYFGGGIKVNSQGVTFSDGTIQSTNAASYAYSTAGYAQANAAFTQANSAYASQNTTGSYANSAYTQANTATTNAATADGKAVTAGNYANSAFLQANSAYTKANNALANTTGTFAGDLTVTGLVKALAAGGDEGGQIDLAKAVTNTTLVTGVSIDVFQNKLRIFETGGTNRGVYIDIANSAATSVGTDLLSGATLAQNAYNQANTATTNAATADSKAVTAGSYANSAYTQANTATTNAATADSKAVTAGSYANSAFGVANSAAIYANGAFVQANSAFTKANGAVQTAFVTHAANGVNVIPASNNDTLNITSAVANGINVLANNTSKTIDIGLRTSGVTSGVYGGSTNIPVITFDSFGRATSASNVAVSTTINLSGNTGSGSVAGGGTLTIQGGTSISTSVSGSTITINNSGVTSFNGATGAVTFGSINVTNALGYTPVSSSGGTFSGAVTVPSLIANTSVQVNSSILDEGGLKLTAGLIPFLVAKQTVGNYGTSSVSQVTLESFATTTYRSAKYLVQMTSGTAYHMIELSLIHDGATVYLSQYGEVKTGASLGTFDASISAGNLNLLFTPTNATTNVNWVRTGIAV